MARRRGRKPSGQLHERFIHTDRGLDMETGIESVRIDYKAPPRQLVAEFQRRVSHIQNLLDDIDRKFLLGRLQEIRDTPGKDAKKSPGRRRDLKVQLSRIIRRLKRLDRNPSQEIALRLARWRLEELEQGNGHPPSKNKCSRLLKHFYGVEIHDSSFDRLWRSVNPPSN